MSYVVGRSVLSMLSLGSPPRNRVGRLSFRNTLQLQARSEWSAKHGVTAVIFDRNARSVSVGANIPLSFGRFLAFLIFAICIFSPPRLNAQSSSVLLSGGPTSTAGISIDDDLSVYVNGVLIFADNNLRDNSQFGYGALQPIVFSAKNGDVVRVVGTDAAAGGCRDLSPLYIHRVADGAVQVLDPVGVQKTCNAEGGGVFYDKTFTISLSGSNQPPSVSVGPNQTITLPGAAVLNGTIADDGLPVTGRLVSNWSVVSGTGLVTFGSPATAATTASFSTDGVYVLRLTVTDSQLSSFADVTVTVKSVASSPTITSVGPNIGQQGLQNLMVEVSGQSTHWVQGVTTANFGSGIGIASLTVHSPTSATALLNISFAALVASRTVTMTTGTEIETLLDGFAVTSASSGPTLSLTLTGGPGLTAEISVDDDIIVYLNGTPVFADSDLHDESRYGYGAWPPIIFSARNGDVLRVVATNTATSGCRDLSPLYLHRIFDGALQILDPSGFQRKCDSAAGGVFYDNSFVIGLAGVDIETPAITINSPANGASINTPSFTVQVAYSDALSGLDLTSFKVTIDGVDFTGLFDIKPTGASYDATLALGQHTVAASIADKVGNSSQAASEFTITTGGLQSLPGAVPTSGTIPLVVTFTAAGVNPGGAITRWRWDFQGDGIFDTDEVGIQPHSFTFTKAGIYQALLEITGNNGQTARAAIAITATNRPPTATADVNPSNGGLPLAVTLTGTGTSLDGTIVKYEWDRTGSGVFDFSSATTGNTTFTYTSEGTYNAVFRVTDNFGQTATAVATATAVRVGPAGSPTARITNPAAPVSGNAPLVRAFNGTGTASAGRTIALYEWDFDGDGTYDFSSPTNPSTSVTYNSPGVFTARFRVTDSTGATGVDTVDIAVNLAATLTLTTDTLRPSNNETLNVRTTISGTVPVTVFIRNKGGQIVRTLVSNVSRLAGTYNDPWDGKDDSGTVLPEGIYYAILQYKNAGGQTRVVDLTTTTGNVLFIPNWDIVMSASGQHCTNTFFSCAVNPLANDFLQANFTLSQAGEVSISVRVINSNIEVVQLFDRQPFGRGIPYSAFWDGTDSTGKALQTPSGDGYLWGMTAFSLPTNGIFLEDSPEVSGVTATPNYFDAATGDFINPGNPTTKISYTLSKSATLVLQVFRSGTNALMQTVTQIASAGSGVIAWDGHASNGLFADSGDYHLALKAIDSAGNQSIVRYVVVRVFY